MVEGAFAECDCESIEVNIVTRLRVCFIPHRVIAAPLAETSTCATVSRKNSVKQLNHGNTQMNKNAMCEENEVY